ncbi:hypothetical protein B566_EDAN012481 [Ephemera danica]|nr:hypothetical protein B566_EDAN012481 [Ephemera danica]
MWMLYFSGISAMAKEHGHFGTDGLEICPYNPSHTVLKSRFQAHLVRCKLTGLPDKLTGKSPCPYNATHIIDEEVMGQHMQVCEDGKCIDTYKYTVGQARNVNILPVENRDIPSEENWDDDDLPTHLKGAPPAERKKYREERRQLYHTHESKLEETGSEGPLTGSCSRVASSFDYSQYGNEDFSLECGAEPFEYNKKKKPLSSFKPESSARNYAPSFGRGARFME